MTDNGDGEYVATLSREAILSAVDMPTSYVDVPQWGGRVKVKGCPVAHPAYVNFIYRGKSKGIELTNEEIAQRRYVGAVIISAIDEDGKQLFSWEDAPRLREKHWMAVVKVATEAFHLARDMEEASNDVEANIAFSEAELTSG